MCLQCPYSLLQEIEVPCRWAAINAWEKNNRTWYCGEKIANKGVKKFCGQQRMKAQAARRSRCASYKQLIFAYLFPSTNLAPRPSYFGRYKKSNYLPKHDIIISWRQNHEELWAAYNKYR